jgi:hypothetical protein
MIKAYVMRNRYSTAPRGFRYGPKIVCALCNRTLIFTTKGTEKQRGLQASQFLSVHCEVAHQHGSDVFTSSEAR